jgi:hypothetical protein
MIVRSKLTPWHARVLFSMQERNATSRVENLRWVEFLTVWMCQMRRKRPRRMRSK